MTRKFPTAVTLKKAPTAATDKSHDGFQNYLEHFGLPSDKILAPFEERAAAIGNVPKLVQNLIDDQWIGADALSFLDPLTT